MKIYKVLWVLLFIISVAIWSCKNNTSNEISSKMSEQEILRFKKEDFLKTEKFDTIIDNKKVELFWIESDSLKAAFTNYGGRLVGLWIPDKNGKFTDVVVGMGTVNDFITSTEPYFGATIGRVGNRIAKGKFSIDGTKYNISINNGEHSLHGGKKGFQDVVWQVDKLEMNKLVFGYLSPDMEEGYPGNLKVQVTYSIEDNSLKMEYKASTDKKTPVNLTNHAFFNLNGEGSGPILDHEVKFYANAFTPVDSGLIPTGELRDVKGTPFDFIQFHTIGERINESNEQLTYGKGYDHNFLLDQTKVNGLNHAATVVGDKSGIVLNIFTQEPGLQFYSGNFMQGMNTFKSGAKDDFRTAFAMETQHFPDAPNQVNFPSIILNPGEEYHTVSIYTFSLKN